MDIASVTDGFQGSKAERAKMGLDKDIGNFLKMLTVQLKNQDPTSPLDSYQFTQQLVAFTGVEQAIDTNKYLEKLVANSNSGELQNYANYIGKEVEINGEFANLVNGKATFRYAIAEDTSKVKIEILDRSKNLVYSESLNNTDPGEHELTWNGRTNSGETAKPGEYSIRITSTDANGNPTRNIAASRGLVGGVTRHNGEVYVIVKGKEIEAGKVISLIDAVNKNSNNDKE